MTGVVFFPSRDMMIFSFQQENKWSFILFCCWYYATVWLKEIQVALPIFFVFALNVLTRTSIAAKVYVPETMRNKFR